MSYKIWYREKLNLWKKRKHFKKEIVFVSMILIALLLGIASSVFESRRIRESCLRRISYSSSGVYRLEISSWDRTYKTFKFQDEAIEYCRILYK